jgi:ubiquinone/menaquinone biosynthesis C-methylase UbiE
MAKCKERSEEAVDWGDEEHLETLIEQRKFMWNKDYVALLAKLIGLKPGSTVADLGCGLGHLGHIFGRFIRPDGSYFGVDQNKKVLNMAQEAAGRHRLSNVFRLIQGSALEIPLKDECVDVSMCQTLLMHLREPESAIREMRRVV